MKLEELHLARGTHCDSLRPPYKEVDHVQIRSSWVATHSVAFLPTMVGWYWHLDCLDRPSTHGIEGHGYVLQVTRKLEDQPLQFPCVISGLEATLVERHFGLVPLSVAHRCTDADILEQGIGGFGSLLTSRGCKGA